MAGMRKLLTITTLELTRLREEGHVTLKRYDTSLVLSTTMAVDTRGLMPAELGPISNRRMH